MKTYCLDYSVWLLIPIFMLLIAALVIESKSQCGLLKKQAKKHNGTYLKGNIFILCKKNLDKYFPQIKFVHNNIPFHLFIKQWEYSRDTLHTTIEVPIITSNECVIWIAKNPSFYFSTKPNYGLLSTLENDNNYGLLPTLRTDNPEIDKKIVIKSSDPDNTFIKYLLTRDIACKILQYQNNTLGILINNSSGLTLKIGQYPTSEKAYDNFIDIATSLCDRLIELGWSP